VILRRLAIMPSVTALPSELPAGYRAFLEGLKVRGRAVQLRVVLSASRAVVVQYWSSGRAILARQHQAGWGAKVIDRVLEKLNGPEERLGYAAASVDKYEEGWF
jgi:hypothetical protein